MNSFHSSGRLFDAILKQDQRITFAILVHIERDRGINHFIEPFFFRAGKNLKRWLARQTDHQLAVHNLYSEHRTRGQFVSADQFL